MKKIICCLVLAVMLSACGGGANKSEANQEEAPRKEGEKRIGDIIMVNGAQGIVIAVTTDGQHGMVMSVSETQSTWDDAKIWCSQYGYGWRLPNKSELIAIHEKYLDLNSVLSANGYPALGPGMKYWALDGSDSDRAWSVLMYNGQIFDQHKDYDNYVRAVSAF